MRRKRRIQRWALVSALALGGTVFQTTGCTGTEFNQIAANMTAGLISSIVNQFIATYVSEALGVPSTSSLTGL